jgi:hypothetical protein
VDKKENNLLVMRQKRYLHPNLLEMKCRNDQAYEDSYANCSSPADHGYWLSIQQE